MAQKQTTVIYNLTAAVTEDEKIHSSDNKALYPGTAESSLFKDMRGRKLYTTLIYFNITANCPHKKLLLYYNFIFRPVSEDLIIFMAGL